MFRYGIEKFFQLQNNNVILTNSVKKYFLLKINVDLHFHKTVELFSYFMMRDLSVSQKIFEDFYGYFIDDGQGINQFVFQQGKFIFNGFSFGL